MRTQLTRITGSRIWRVLNMLRRAGLWLVGKSHVAHETNDVIAQDAVSVPSQGPARQFLAQLPAEVVLPQATAPSDPHVSYRCVDFRSVMAQILPPVESHSSGEMRSSPDDIFLGQGDPKVRLAYVGGEELLGQLAFDARLTRLTAGGWRQQVEASRRSAQRFNLLLVEVAAHHSRDGWHEAFTTDGLQRARFRDMQAMCRACGIPVVCWFREGITCYEDAAWLGDGADALFAHDPAVADRLRLDYPSRPVQWMPPAIQPRRYYPARPPALVRAARRAGDHILFDNLAAALAKGGLPASLEASGDIVLVGDSHWDVPIGQLRSQPHLARLALGAYGCDDRSTLLRLVGAEFFESGRTVMDQQHQLEAAACGAIVTGPGALPWLGAGTESLEASLADPIQRARSAHLAMRRVLSQHTMADRLQTMLDAVGCCACLEAGAPKIACLLITRRLALLEECLSRFRADIYPNKELIVVVHDSRVDLRHVRTLIGTDEPIRIMRMSEEYGLGACLNFAFEHTDATYWAKWDDDDFYGPHYLSDFMLYRRAVDFDVAGKPMAFTWLDEPNELLWDGKWGERAHVMRSAVDHGSGGVAGATLVGHRRVLESVQFPNARRRGTDSEFLRRCHEVGWNLLATDPFNFVRYRTTQNGFHTWRVDENVIRKGSLLVGSRDDIGNKAFV